MRNLMIFAALMVVFGTVMGQMADKMTPATPALANAGVPTAAAETVGQTGPAASALPATPVVISSRRGGSRASASASWSIPALPSWP